MGRRPATFLQSDVTRALKAAKAAGLPVTGCSIAPGGEIALQFADAQPGLSDLEAWRQRKQHDAR